MEHLCPAHRHLHDRYMSASATRSEDLMERLAYLDFRTRVQRGQSVAQTVGWTFVEEEEERLASMICSESHRKRLGQRWRNLL
jgi:hypothetical protein